MDRPATDTGFWREVPCGHPPDPVAAVSFDGHLVCHCGWILDDEHSVDYVEVYAIVPCQKCGCHVGIPEWNQERLTHGVPRHLIESVDA